MRLSVKLNYEFGISPPLPPPPWLSDVPPPPPLQAVSDAAKIAAEITFLFNLNCDIYVPPD